MEIWSNRMANKLMNIPNDDTQNYPFCRIELMFKTLYALLNEPTNQNSIKVPKVFNSTNKKMFLKDFR